MLQQHHRNVRFPASRLQVHNDVLLLRLLQQLDLVAAAIPTTISVSNPISKNSCTRTQAP
jgi:hypothetical protein